MFDKTVMDVEGKDSSNYKTWNLKKRLTKRYPQICFLQPSCKYESQFVYVDNLSTDKLLVDSTLLHESIISSDTDNTDTDDHEDNVSENERLPRRLPLVIDGNKESSPTSSKLRDRSVCNSLLRYKTGDFQCFNHHATMASSCI